MSLEITLREGIQAAIKSTFDSESPIDTITLQPTRKEFAGTYTFVTFPLTRLSKLSPEATGEKLGEYLKAHLAVVSGFNVVKGFLNLEIGDSYWIQLLEHISKTPNYGIAEPNGVKVMVEYSSPNTNKPLHLGHLRNNFLGFSVSQILKASGYDVVKANLINDRGIHICKSMLAYQKFGNGETPESSGLKGDHLVGKYYVAFDKALKEASAELAAQGLSEDDIKKQNPLLLEAQNMLHKWEAGDTEVVALWKKMNSWVYEGFGASYKQMGVSFDKYYYESDTYLLGKSVVEEGLEKGVFYKKENGSIAIDLSAEGLDEKILLRSDGTSVYITQDMGTADLKYKEHQISKSIYVVGNEQDYHFVVLQHIMKKLGRPYAEGIYHLSYGMVDLPSGKMKSREGTVVDADDLMQEMIDTARQTSEELGKLDDMDTGEAAKLYNTLGLGALKYFLLKVDPKKRMLFNPAESIDFHGHTGPFIQYTYARISAILRKAKQMNVAIPASFKITDLHPTEQSTLVLLHVYPDIIQKAAAEYAPSVVANYIYELAKEYNRFYTEISIFNETNLDVFAFRVAFCKAVAETIASGMLLLGIDVPERM